MRAGRWTVSTGLANDAILAKSKGLDNLSDGVPLKCSLAAGNKLTGKPGELNTRLLDAQA